jgi:hypothetical protein
MRKETKRFYIQLSALLFLTGVVFFSILWVANNWDHLISNFSGDVHQEITYDELLDEDFKVVNIDACDANTTTKPNSKANISLNNMYEYYAYTDDQSRVFLVHAKNLYRKEDRVGRYCSYTFPNNKNEKAKTSIGYIQNSSDDRGHLIADRFDGVSNAYNVTAQQGSLNKGAYSDLEDRLDQALANNQKVTDFYVKVNYRHITDRRPESYTVSFKINNKTYLYELDNQ